MDLVSIVVPVYNAERYIRRCLDSLLLQTYHPVEIIVIDDGSTDKSLEICTEYAEHNWGVKVLHTANYGVSHARNTGLVCAKGKYVFFVDADDYIMPCYVEHFMNEGDFDYVAGGYRENDELGWKKEYNNYVISLEEFVNDCRNAWEKVPTVHVHGNRYSKEVIDINDIRFNEKCAMGEDVRFNIEYLKNVAALKVCDKSEYIYCLNKESAIHKYWDNRLVEEREECIEKERLYVPNQSFNYMRYVHWMIALEHYHDHAKNDKINGERAKIQLRNTVRDTYFRQCIQYCKSDGTLDMKLAALCLQIGSYRLYKWIMKIL